MQTVEEARAFIASRKDDGARCPVCGQLVKIYKYPISSGQAMWLIWLVKLYRSERRWIAASECSGKFAGGGGGYGRLKHWGLIRPHSRRSGFWKPTKKGRLFVRKKITVQRRVHMLLREPIGFDGEQISITDALGTKFDYEKLMRDAL